MSGERRCNGETERGACRAPAALVGDDGWCDAHRPGVGSEQMRERARKGGEATRKLHQAEGLSEADLPRLASPEQCERFLEVVATAVATGKLAKGQAQAATRAVREWLRAHEAGKVEERIAELQEQVQELKRGV